LQGAPRKFTFVVKQKKRAFYFETLMQLCKHSE